MSFSIASRLFLSLRRHQRERRAVLAGAAGAADAVDVIVGVARRLVIEHMADVGNVEPARGDVGGDQELQIAGAEAVERLGAQAIDRDRRGSARR